MTTSEIATVLAWHDALNEQDLDTLIQVSSDDIEFGDAQRCRTGTRRAARVGEFAGNGGGRSGRMYVRDGVVVAEEEDGKASAFRVVHDHVTSVFRHHDLATALAATELTEQDLAG